MPEGADLERVTAIHAVCEDLAFLPPVWDKFAESLVGGFRRFDIRSQFDGPAIMHTLERQNTGLVIFSCHGGDGYLKAGDPSRTATEQELAVWFRRGDCHVLKGKAVFCLGCETNSLASASVEAGATAFVGFDKIMWHRFEGENPINEPELTECCQNHIAIAVELALRHLIVQRARIGEAAAFLALSIRRLLQDYVRYHASDPHRRTVVAYGEAFARGARVSGNAGWIMSD